MIPIENVVRFIRDRKSASWRDGHYLWQVHFEVLHDIDQPYSGFYFDTPPIGQIYDRSSADHWERGTCVPASFEMAVDHLYPPSGQSSQLSPVGHAPFACPRSILGRVPSAGSRLGERLVGGMRYPLNQVMLHDVFRCNTGRMMRTVNDSSLELIIAENSALIGREARADYLKSDDCLKVIPRCDWERWTLLEGYSFPIANLAFTPTIAIADAGVENPCSVFTTIDIRTWNLVRALFQGRTPIITYSFPRPHFIMSDIENDESDIPTVRKPIQREENMRFEPDRDPEICGHAVVVVGVRNRLDCLEFRINDPGPSPAIDIRSDPFTPIDPDEEIPAGSRYWIPESFLLEGIMSIDSMFELSRETRALYDVDVKIHALGEFRLGRKSRKPRRDRLVMLP